MEDFFYRARPWAITLVLHNWPIMIYSLLVLWVAIRAYLRPRRSVLLFLYGLLVMAFAFEYQKHGVEVARTTTAYLFSTYANPSARNISQLILVDILPAALHLFGLALFLAGAALSRQPRPLDAVD